MKTLLETNEFQTSITDELLEAYPKEVREEFFDIVNNVEFIKRLISPSRKRAKDLPKDGEGKIIVDIMNPHILEDMDYFRETALHFQKTGRFTDLRPNGNPNSDFMKWLRRETRRCWYGMVRPSDGEWVTGEMYFYLNYMPMELTEKIEGQSKAVNRTTSTPRPWEGSYLWFHYIYQARYGGLYDWEGGHDALQIATRGAGKAHPYSEFIYTPEGKKLWGELNIGDYVFGDDGMPTKIIDIPFDDITDIYEFTLKDGRKVKSSSGHLWNVFKYGKEKIVSTSDIANKYYINRSITNRNPTGREYFYQLPVNSAVNYTEQEVKVDPYTFGLLLGDGSFRHYKSNLGRLTAAPYDMDIYRKYIPYDIYQLKEVTEWCIKIPEYREYLMNVGLYMKKSEDKFIPKEFLYNTKDIRLNLLKGLIDSDGTIDNRGTYSVSTSSSILADDITILCRSLGFNCRVSKKSAGYKVDNSYISCKPSYTVFIYSSCILTNLPRKQDKLKIKTTKYSRSKIDRTTIVDVKLIGRERSKCISVDNNSHCYLINDFIVTHNSFSCASMLARLFILGDNENYKRKVNAFIMASNKDTLSNKDGTLKKFEACIDLNAELMQWPAQRLYASLDKMVWEMGYIDPDTNTKKGTRNGVYGITTNDDAEKGRGSRGAKIIYEEMGRFPKFQTVWTVNEPSVRDGKDVWGQMIGIGTGGSEGCLTGDNYIFTSDGNIKYIKDLIDSDGIIGYDINSQEYSIEKVEHINIPTMKECIKLHTNSLRELECSIDHPIYASSKYDYNERRIWDWIEAKDLKEGDLVAICNEIPIFANEPMFDSRLIGLLIGDGTYIESPRLVSCDEEIKEYIRNKYNTSVYGKSYYTDTGKLCETLGIKGIRDELRKLEIYGQSGNNKRLPKAVFKASKEDVANLIAGLIDTDGNINIYNSNKGNRLPSTTVSISISNKELAKQVQLLLVKLGIYANIIIKKPSIKIKRIMDKNPYYSLEISSRDSIIKLYESTHLLIKYKQDKLEEAYNINLSKKRWRSNKFEYETIKKIDNVGVKTVYNLSAGNTHTYLGNGIITHNSNFYGILQMIYNPKGYNVYAVPNLYDKNSNGDGKTIFFFGAYLNRGGYYNKDGVSDVTATILDILQERYDVKYNSTDPNRLTQVVAERPLTIQEAIMRKESSLFPSAQLSDRKNELDSNPQLFDDVYTGRMTIRNGVPEFIPVDVNVIREFPHKDNKLDGGIEIFEMPKKDRNGNVFSNRYIAGTDPVDDDDAKESLSLQSTFILDLWTDDIVAEYTGRPTFADDYYEQLRLLLMFYNARDNYENNKKGLFGYFNRMSSLYLLNDRLEYLKDKEITKVPGVGNNSKGYSANKFINSYGRLLYRNWLLAPVTVVRNIEGVDKEITISRLYTLRSRALIQESIQWESLGNYDRVSSMVALMLYREFMVIQYQGDFSQTRVDEVDRTYLGNDKFFSDNYDSRIRSIN